MVFSIPLGSARPLVLLPRGCVAVAVRTENTHTQLRKANLRFIALLNERGKERRERERERGGGRGREKHSNTCRGMHSKREEERKREAQQYMRRKVPQERGGEEGISKAIHVEEGTTC